MEAKGNIENKKIWNWGIFGPAGIARAFAEGLKILDNANIYAVASRSEERSRTFAENFPVERVYSSYEDALQDEDLEICYIANLNNDHYPLAKACLEAGKHILVEKPSCLNSEMLIELVELAKTKNLFFMEAMWTKFLATTKKVNEWVNDEKIGEISSLECSFGFESGLDPESRVLALNKGGSALLDLGVYTVSYADMLFPGYPESICYNANTTADNVDITGAGSLIYKDNKVATFIVSVANQLTNYAKITGTKGSIYVSNFMSPIEASLYEGISTNLKDNKLIETFEQKNLVNGYEYEAMHVMECLDKGLIESPIHTWEDNINVLKIMDKMRADISLVYPEER